MFELHRLHSHRVAGPAALVLIVGLAACGRDALIDPSHQPRLPAAAAVHADFSFFTDRAPTGGPTLAWDKAVSRVAEADAALSVLLAVPFEALSAAATATPSRQGTMWRWPLDFNVGFESFTGELRGAGTGNQYGWDLVLSAPMNDPPLSNFLWAVGYMAADGGQGLWTIANAADGTNEVAANVSWLVNAQDEASFIAAVSDSSAWAYERADGTSVLTYLVGTESRLRVTWRTTAGTGSTWSLASDVTECWNADLHDTACS